MFIVERNFDAMIGSHLESLAHMRDENDNKSDFSHTFLILFIFTFGISSIVLKKMKLRGQNKAIKLFNTDDVLLMQKV